MSDISRNDRAQRRENRDPQESFNPVPRLMLGLIGVLFGWALFYIYTARPATFPSLGDRRSAEVLAAVPARAVDGEQIFGANCVACHQASGAGIPLVFPPLAGSAWVDGSEHVLIQILLHGIKGSIEVAGSTFNGEMPAFGEKLGDAEIAAVASYIRSQWGNQAGPVTAETVQDQRKLTGGRSTPWNGGAELATLK
ncbi:cytochrome c [Aromatoleum evansii]|uniref:Cytochrome c n=1 Tax=Aromatoleum evansii TaxID=59406 RepID=A0ABZ1AVJ7_AROEV|nr:cytochrome c [Aromatoleum evansii]